MAAESDSGEDDGFYQLSEDEEEFEEQSAQCFFCDQVNLLTQVLEHMTTKHDFNLNALTKSWHLDFYAYIRLCNWMRRYANGHASFKELNLNAEHALFKDDALLLPAKENDTFLTTFDDEAEEEEDMTTLRQKVHDLELAYHDLQEVAKRTLTEGDVSSDSDEEQNKPCTRHTHQTCDDGTDEYFMSYARLGIHGDMLRDAVRTGSYRDFVYKNRHMFEGKVVIDVGAGTGILSMFAAHAGARRVYAIEASAVADVARANIAANGLSSVIQVVRGRSEECELPEKADVIISEWMGYFLLFENMLASVIDIRDRYLAPGGVVQPSHAIILLSGFECPERWEYEVKFYDDVYGFNMAATRDCALREASVEYAQPSGQITDYCELCTLDTNTVPLTMFDANSGPMSYDFHLIVKDTDAPYTCHALVGHFDIEFRSQCKEVVSFSTSAASTETHWKQTVFYFPQPIDRLTSGDQLNGSLVISRSSVQEHSIEIRIKLRVFRKNGKELTPHESFDLKYLI